MTTVTLHTSNRIWLTYRHFPYKAWYAVGELVDNSTQSYFSYQATLDEAYEQEGSGLAVRIDFERDEMLSIVDNAMGMDLDDLQRAIQLGTPPPDTSGRSEFGMGMKTACCWLGDEWRIVTKKLGSDTEYSVTIDVPEIAKSTDNELAVVEKVVPDTSLHYTRIEVTRLHRQFQTKTLGRTKAHLMEMYRPDIEMGTLDLRWDGSTLQPPAVEVLVTDVDNVQRTWKKDIDFVVDGEHNVRGWICILAKGGRAKAGFDLFRRGRIILGRPGGYRPALIFGESRNDLINQRLYGQIHLDDFPVNHLKDDFLWEGLEDEFQDHLVDACQDYIDFARAYRSRAGSQHVSPAVVQATNEEIAEELGDEQMAERLTIAEVGAIADETDDAVRDAKAELLREQKIDPRVIEAGGYTFRIFHPQAMPGTDPYFFRQSAETGEVDIFLNDNHPYAEKITDETDYLMYARMCVIDAITEHFLVHHKGEMTAGFPARLKDNLLRGFKL